MNGSMEELKKILAPHPTTRVPLVLYEVYQQVYTSFFVLSKMTDSPCPSPELLSPRQHHPSKESGVGNQNQYEDETDSRTEPSSDTEELSVDSNEDSEGDIEP